MKNSHFVTSILIVTLLSFGLVHWTINGDPNATRASWIMIIFFVCFTIALFVFALRAAKSSDLYQFSRIFLASIMIKMFGFIFLIVMMIKKFNVDSKNLILPSIVIYVLFTIVETYSLMKLSKSR